MQALLDGDICAFRCAAASEDTDQEICILRLDRMIQEILYITQADTHQVFLSGSGNFRYDIYPEYKANRKDKEKPQHLQACRDYLVEHWNAVLSSGCEADDLLGIEQDKDTVICSIDKDLLQIPGKHFNFVKQEFTEQTYFEGIRFFYHQLLKGDRSDNIPGVAGLGEVKARKLLEFCDTEQEMFDICREKYGDDDTMLMYGKCLWIWRKEHDIWDPSKLLTGEHQSNLEEEEMLHSTTQKQEE